MLSWRKKRNDKNKKVHMSPTTASMNTQMTSIEEGNEVLQP
jgi:hypothetical protein